MQDNNSPQPESQCKPYIENVIAACSDGTLDRLYFDAYKIDAETLAVSVAQYLYLHHVVIKTLDRLQAIGVQRFGKESFNATCQAGWQKLGQDPKIVKAIQMVPWMDVHEEVDEDAFEEGAK